MVVETSITATSSIRVLQTLVKSKSDKFRSIWYRCRFRPFRECPIFWVFGRRPLHGNVLMQLSLALLVYAKVILSFLSGSHNGIDFSLYNQTLLLSPGNPWTRQRKTEERQQEGWDQHGHGSDQSCAQQSSH